MYIYNKKKRTGEVSRNFSFYEYTLLLIRNKEIHMNSANLLHFNSCYNESTCN